MDFEDKIEKIKDIINKLNSADINLKDSMKLYNEGIKEINSAQKMLEEAKNQYENIKNKDLETKH